MTYLVGGENQSSLKLFFDLSEVGGSLTQRQMEIMQQMGQFDSCVAHGGFIRQENTPLSVHRPVFSVELVLN